MKRLIIPRNDIGYYFLLEEISLIDESTEQLEFEFEENEKNIQSGFIEPEEYLLNSLINERYS